MNLVFVFFSPFTFLFAIGASDLDGGRFFFNAVKEGDSVVFAADDEAESHLWVMALYRATGQSHKPAPPLTPSGKSSTIAKIQGGTLLSRTNFWWKPWKLISTYSVFHTDTDRARKHGMEEYISADPVKFDHSLLFKLVQTLTLDFRLNDPFASLVFWTCMPNFIASYFGHLFYFDNCSFL